MNIVNFFLILILLNFIFYVIDKLICISLIYNFKEHITKRKDYGRIRWYFLHIFINILTVITSIKGVQMSYNRKYTSLTPIKMAEPLSFDWFFGETSPLPTLLVASGHLYHILFFSTTNEDIYHHLLFAGTMSFLNMMGDYGSARNVIQFVLSGLPGIFEYTIMCLYKLDCICKKYEIFCYYNALFIKVSIRITNSLAFNISNNI